jgi:probable phosphoglycerate mutase
LTRAVRVVNRLREVNGDTLVFSSGHFLRMVIARWLDLEPIAGKLFFLSTGGVSVLGYEHDLSRPVLRLLNNTSHIEQTPVPK